MPHSRANSRRPRHSRLSRPSLLLACLCSLLLLPGCTPRDEQALQTGFSEPAWMTAPNVTGVPADLNGRWERIDDPESSTEVHIEHDAMQKLGRNPMDRYDLMRAFGLATLAPLEIYVNHFGSDRGVLAIAWDHLEKGGSKMQYGIRAVVDAQGQLWLAFTQNSQQTANAQLIEDSWFWRCRRRP